MRITLRRWIMRFFNCVCQHHSVTIHSFNLTNCSLEQIVFYQTFRFSPVFSWIYSRVKNVQFAMQTFGNKLKPSTRILNYNLHLDEIEFRNCDGVRAVFGWCIRRKLHWSQALKCWKFWMFRQTKLQVITIALKKANGFPFWNGLSERGN